MKFTVKQFEERFPTEESCLEELKQLRFSNYKCDKCGELDRLSKIPGRPTYQCVCGKQVSPLAGTIFHKTHASLKTWFFVMYVMSQTRSGVSAKQMERMTGLSYRAVWRMMRQIRFIMDTDGMMDGDIETDETFFAPKSARNTRLPRNPKKQTVMAVLERDTGKVIARHVPKPDMPSLKALTSGHVKPGATIHTDGALFYRRALKGYVHMPVTHWSVLPRPSQDFSYFVPSMDMGTQNIENFWGILKRGIKGTYIHVSPKYLQLYTQEYAWRYTHRKSALPLFELILKRIGS